MIPSQDPLDPLDGFPILEGVLTPEEKLKSEVDFNKIEEELGFSTGQAELVLNLLASGVTPQEVAFSQGLTEDTMRRVVEHKVYVGLIRACVTARHALNESTNVLMDTLEHKALLKVSTSIEGMSTGEALATFKVLNSATRRDSSAVATKKGDLHLEVLGDEEVELQVLPPTVPKFKQNASGAIYEVGGRAMETIGEEGLKKLALEHKQKMLSKDSDTGDT